MVDGERNNGLRLDIIIGMLGIGLLIGIAVAGCDDSSQPLPGDGASIVGAASPHDAGASD
jgi:hypothetical protein